MHKFKDSEGREWLLSVNVAAARHLKDGMGIDLLDGGHSLQTLAGDPFTAANAIYLLCEKQAQAAGISDEQFGERLAGDSFEEAITALIEEIVDFFPKRHRGMMRAAILSLDKAKGEAAAMAETKFPQMATAVVKQMEAEMDQMIADLAAGASSGNSQAQPV